MKNNVAKRSVINILISFSSQTITLALGLILPRLLITGFGSEVNGFFSTTTQLFSYLEVLRAGVGMATIQALYPPIVNDDKDTISKIVSTSKKYFFKLGYIYLGCTFLLSILLTIRGNSGLTKSQIFLIVLIQGISGWISFSLINWFIDLLRAEGKNYIFIGIKTFGNISLKLLEVFLILTIRDPVIFKSTSLLIISTEFIFFLQYRKKYYNSYNFRTPSNNTLLKDRKSYLIFHITSLICTNTDIVVLSIFCGYGLSSVYSIYYMIVVGVNTIINTIYSSTTFLLGHSYQHGIDYFKRVHDSYYLVYTTLTTSLFSICYILFLPFVKLYTNGVTDINYIYTWLPFLFCVIQIFTCSKNVGDITINIGGFAKNVVWRAALEATINIIASIILVNYIGIYGVLIGTIIALSYRLIDVMFFSNIKVLHRFPKKNIKVFITNLFLFCMIVFANMFISIDINNYIDFIKFSIAVTPLIIIVFSGTMVLTSKTDSIVVINYIRRKFFRRLKFK